MLSGEPEPSPPERGARRGDQGVRGVRARLRRERERERERERRARRGDQKFRAEGERGAGRGDQGVHGVRARLRGIRGGTERVRGDLENRG